MLIFFFSDAAFRFSEKYKDTVGQGPKIKFIAQI